MRRDAQWVWKFTIGKMADTGTKPISRQKEFEYTIQSYGNMK